jgi:hypothetical protein
VRDQTSSREKIRIIQTTIFSFVCILFTTNNEPKKICDATNNTYPHSFLVCVFINHSTNDKNVCPHDWCKCNVGCITSLVRLIITRESFCTYVILNSKNYFTKQLRQFVTLQLVLIKQGFKKCGVL